MLEIDPKRDVITSSQIQRDFGGVIDAVANGQWKYITSGDTTIALIPFDQLRDMLVAKEEQDARRLVNLANEAQERANKGEGLDVDSVISMLDKDYQARYGNPAPALTEASIKEFLDVA